MGSRTAHAEVEALIADKGQAGDAVIFTDGSVVRGSKSGWAFTARVDGGVEAEESDATDPTLSSMQTEINAITFALSWVKHQDYRSILIVTDSLSTLEKIRGSNLHADWTPHIRDSQIQKITWIYCLQLSSVVGNKAADKLAGDAAISDQINPLDPHSFINLVTSALDDNPLPSSSHTLQCVKYSGELRGDGARSQLCCLTRRQTNQLLCCIVKVPTLRWTLGGGGKMWICPSCNNADPCPNKYSKVKRGQYACKVIY